MVTQTILLTVIALINLVAFIVVGWDKRKSMVGNGDNRTPEGILFFVASTFGAVGVLAGMLVYRHKIRKWYFVIGIPLLVVENAVTVYVLQELFLQL